MTGLNLKSPLSSYLIFCLLITLIIGTIILYISDSPSTLEISKADGIVTAKYINGTVVYTGPSDSEAISKSIAAGSTILFAKGTYNIDRIIPLKSDLSLIGEDGATLKCNLNDRALYTDSVAYSSSTTPLANDAHSGDSQIELSNVTGLKAGDNVKISDDFGIYDGDLTFNSGSISPDKKYYRNGEIAKITVVSGNKITIDRPLYDSYAVSKNAKIRSISMLKNIIFENIDFIGYGMGTNSGAIDLDGAQNCRISNCDFTDFGDHAVFLVDCLDCTIEKNIFRRVYLDGIGYSIGLSNACDNITIRSNSFLEKGRHYIAVGCSTGDNIDDGLCRTVHVTNNIFEYSTSEAINAHPSTRSMFEVTNNKFTNCAKGVQFYNTNSTISDNVFTNCINSIELYGTGNHLIKGNSFCGENNSIGIYVCDSDGGTYSIISNTISAANYGILLENTRSSPIQDKIIIQSNNINAATLVSKNGYSNVLET